MNFRKLAACAAVAIPFVTGGCNVNDGTPVSGPTSPVDGVWMLVKDVSISDNGGDLYRDSTVFDTSSVYSRRFVIIGGGAIFTAAFSLSNFGDDYSGSASFSRFVSLGNGRYLVGNDTVTTKKTGSTLVVAGTTVDEVDGTTIDTTTLVAYTGKFPPDEWFAPPDSILEPDNTRLTAKPILTTGEYQFRYLSPNDVDWFSFKAEEGTVYEIYTYSESLEAQIDVYSPTGRNLETDTQYLTWECPSTGTYYFRVRAVNSEDKGVYAASIYADSEYYNNNAMKAGARAPAALSGLIRSVPLRLYPQK